MTDTLLDDFAWLAERNMAPLSRTRVDVVGNEDSLGAHSAGGNSREIYGRIAIQYEEGDAWADRLEKGDIAAKPRHAPA